MFKSSHLYYSEEESADYGLVNEMMSDQFAEYLSDTDLLIYHLLGIKCQKRKKPLIHIS